MGELAQMLRTSKQLDWLRLMAAAVLTTGIYLLDVRQGDDWSALVLFLVAAVPCALLSAIALANATVGTALERWQSGLMVAVILLAFVALGELATTLGADESPGPGAIFWITAVLAIVSVSIAVRYKSPIQTLIASLLAIVSFFAMLSWADADLDFSDVRDILAGFTVVYWIVAYGLLTYRREVDANHAHFVVLAGGFAGVIAGSIGAGTSASVIGAFVPSGGNIEPSSDGWEFFLLAVSLLLIGYTFWQGYRGSAYLGVIGLSVFVIVNQKGGAGGWALWLTLIGAAVLVASLFGKQIGGKLQGPSAPSNSPPPQPPPQPSPPAS